VGIAGKGGFGWVSRGKCIYEEGKMDNLTET
jgi:hypothetical protein